MFWQVAVPSWDMDRRDTRVSRARSRCRCLSRLEGGQLEVFFFFLTRIGCFFFFLPKLKKIVRILERVFFLLFVSAWLEKCTGSRARRGEEFLRSRSESVKKFRESFETELVLFDPGKYLRIIVDFFNFSKFSIQLLRKLFGKCRGDRLRNYCDHSWSVAFTLFSNPRSW